MTTPNQLPVSVRLESIREPEYATWLAQSMAEYVEERVQAGNYHPNEALQRAEQQFRELLPQGPATPSQHLFSIVDATTSDRVGVIWFAEKQRGPRLEAFVYDLVVLELFRRRGYARAAMIAIEHEVRQFGINRIGLHVFGHNRGAWALYDQLGYEVTNVQMAKTVALDKSEDYHPSR